MISTWMFRTSIVVGLLCLSWATGWAQTDSDVSICKASEPKQRVEACSRIMARSKADSAEELEARYHRALAHHRLAAYGAAITDMDRVIARRPDVADYYFHRGRARSYARQFDLAIGDYNEGLKRDPKQARFYNNRGWMYAEKGLLDLATKDIDEALRLDPKMLAAVLNRGFILDKQGKKAEAIAQYRSILAAEARPNDEGDEIAKRLALERLTTAGGRATTSNPQQHAVAAAEAQMALQDQQSRACEQATGDVVLEKCGPIISDLGASAGRRVAALNKRSVLLYDRRQYEAAMADLDNLILLDPRHAVALNRRGYAKIELNRNADAIADFDRAIAIDPALLWLYNNRGNAYRNLGNFDKALADYTEAIRREPRYLYPLKNRGYTYERMGFFIEAETIYRQVVAAAGRPGNDEDAKAKRDAQIDLKRIASVLQARSRLSKPIGSRAALLIANSNYVGTFNKLTTPASDAKSLAAALKLIGFRDEDINEKYDLDRRSLISTLRDFEAKARTVDWALVFFAGHGVRARSNLDYIIPIDAQISAERDLADEAVALERVVERISEARKLQMIIFDACRSNELTRRLYASTEALRSGPASAAPFEAPGLMLAFSAKRGQAAFDGDKHSPFVEALLANIVKPGVDIEGIFTLTADQVRKATNDQQAPEIFGLGYGKGVVLVPR